MTVAKLNKDLEAVWWFDLGGYDIDASYTEQYTDIAVSGDYVYVTGEDNDDGDAIWCIDQSTSELAWSAGRNASDISPPLPWALGNANWSVMADSNGCYVCSNSYVYHLDTSGALQWETNLNYTYGRASCTDGTYLYINNIRHSGLGPQITQLNKSGGIVSQWNAGFHDDMTTDGTHLWTVNRLLGFFGITKWTTSGALRWSKNVTHYGTYPLLTVTNYGGKVYSRIAGTTTAERGTMEVDSSGTRGWTYEHSWSENYGDSVTDGSHIFLVGASSSPNADIAGDASVLKIDMNGDYVAHKTGFLSGTATTQPTIWYAVALDGDYLYLVGHTRNLQA